tara:strand:- start:606 stop:878 length:273 start_codon:yes stop_codon:yes gene_type:complete
LRGGIFPAVGIGQVVNNNLTETLGKVGDSAPVQCSVATFLLIPFVAKRSSLKLNYALADYLHGYCPPPCSIKQPAESERGDGRAADSKNF